jgi:hypothetical protein
MIWRSRPSGTESGRAAAAALLLTSSIGRSRADSGVCERGEPYDDDGSSALREAAAFSMERRSIKSVAVSVSRGTARIPPDACRVNKGASMPTNAQGVRLEYACAYLAEL